MTGNFLVDIGLFLLAAVAIAVLIDWLQYGAEREKYEELSTKWERSLNPAEERGDFRDERGERK